MAGPYTLAQIVSRLGGRVVGDASVEIEQVGSLEHAGRRGRFEAVVPQLEFPL